MPANSMKNEDLWNQKKKEEKLSIHKCVWSWIISLIRFNRIRWSFFFQIISFYTKVSKKFESKRFLVKFFYFFVWKILHYHGSTSSSSWSSSMSLIYLMLLPKMLRCWLSLLLWLWLQSRFKFQGSLSNLRVASTRTISLQRKIRFNASFAREEKKKIEQLKYTDDKGGGQKKKEAVYIQNYFRSVD